MRRQLRSTTTPLVASDILKFVSRADQLRLRGRRNYDRYMLLAKKVVTADSPERVRWQRESAEESQREVEWNRRHGPIPGGATILPWRDQHEGKAPTSASVS
jgi:hypothetical protein